MSTESHVHGDDPDTEGRTLPPYEGRRETADVENRSEGVKDGAKVAGATGPVEDGEMKAPDPSSTERGSVAGPSEEQPADQMPESVEGDPGVGPAHMPGTTRGEDMSED